MIEILLGRKINLQNGDDDKLDDDRQSMITESLTNWCAFSRSQLKLFLESNVLQHR